MENLSSIPTYDKNKLSYIFKESDELLILENMEGVEFDNWVNEPECLWVKTSSTSDEHDDVLYITKVVYDDKVTFLLRVNILDSVFGTEDQNLTRLIHYAFELAKDDNLIELLDSLRPGAQEIAANLAKKFSEIPPDDPRITYVENVEEYTKQTELQNEQSRKERLERLNLRRTKLGLPLKDR